MEIVCLQNGKSSTAAYCLPSVAGTIDNYLELAKAIGPAYLIYGIQFADRTQTGKFREFSSLREMAAAMVPDLLAHHRNGPVCLIGYSFSAFLAIELAQQLIEHGRSVPLVAMIVGRGPSASVTPLFRVKHFIKSIGPWAARAMVRAATDSSYRSYFHNRMTHKLRGEHRFVGLDWYEDLPRDYQDYVTNNDANLRKYRFEGAYRGKILLFRQGPLEISGAHPLRFDQLDDYGWGYATGADVDVSYNPHTYGSTMERPNVVHIANALRVALTECDHTARIAEPKSSV